MALEYKSRYRVENGKTCIDIRVKNSRQLFDSRDPAPFLERDLDDDAVDYIQACAEEIPFKNPVKLVIHLSEEPTDGVTPEIIIEAISTFFAYESDLLQKKLSRQMKNGEIFLAIGIFFLVACLILAQVVSRIGNVYLRVFLSEGFTITGWVAMWKPLEVFLFEWWPLYERLKQFRKLTNSEIEILIKKT